MPYKKIVFIKLFLDILDGDERFLYKLNDRQQLLYIKLLLLAGKTKNNIPLDFEFITDKIKYRYDSAQFLDDVDAISTVFTKFCKNGTHYYFEKFDELHNRIDDSDIGDSSSKELQRNSKGTPKESLKEKKKEKENKKEKEKYRNLFLSLWGNYPSKLGKEKAENKFLSTVKTDQDWQDIQTALKNYNNSKRVKAGYVQNGSTWFNNWRDWVINPEPISDKEKEISEMEALLGK